MKLYSIVGQKHRGFDLVGTLPGTPVVLVREPDNKFDPNAIMVWIEFDDGLKHVGYVPSKDAGALAPFIDQQGHEWFTPVAVGAHAAADSAVESGICKKPFRAIDAKFARSPNSGYPQVQVSE